MQQETIPRAFLRQLILLASVQYKEMCKMFKLAGVTRLVRKQRTISQTALCTFTTLRTSNYSKMSPISGQTVLRASHKQLSSQLTTPSPQQGKVLTDTRMELISTVLQPKTIQNAISNQLGPFSAQQSMTLFVTFKTVTKMRRALKQIVWRKRVLREILLAGLFFAQKLPDLTTI
ncbi:Hypothetical_protein [Hexamita inflata]|uniref:Hypothetical_protein n=1 Tax=Hexamita inflata TaxID=28002 RepID=A0AA86R7S4_9EUKA|nr:Hypothetical protein HINF_LOCUS55372 [Hexamita inflata]